MGYREISEIQIVNTNKTVQRSADSSHLLITVFLCFPFLKFSFTSMQKGKLRHIHTTSAFSTSWGHELQRTNTIVDLPLGQVFITPWKPVYWLFTSFSFKAQDWNSGTRFTVVLSKSVQPVARMTHAVMQRNSGQIFLLNESAHQQYIQPSISLA